MTRRSPRDIAADIAATLRKAGHVAWFAGGCVRDQLLGRDPKDYDIVTDATPDDVLKCFPRAQPVGAAFGVMLVRRHGMSVELATFRSDGIYVDHRRPETIEFATAREDAERRDFTVNGLFYDPETDEVHDYVDGIEDLNARILRAIGDPEARFNDDHLRMLRAVRFHAALDMEIESNTEAAIIKHASNLSGISTERIGDECRRILSCDERIKGIDKLERLGLGASLFGNAAQGHEWKHLESVGRSHADLPALFAAWAIDRNLGSVDINALIAQFRDRLSLSNQERDAMEECLTIPALFSEWGQLTVAGRKRLAARRWSSAGLALYEVSDAAMAQSIRQDIAVLAETDLSPTRLIDGARLVGIGVEPGPEMGRILESVYDAQLEGRVQTLEQALSLAQELSGK